MKFLFILFFMAIVLPRVACADGDSTSHTEFNIQTGPMLPDQIQGVTEILPVWGFFYKIPMAGGGVEFGLLDAHAKGVDFTMLPIRGRFDIPFDEYLTAIVFAGPEINYYSQANTSNRITEVGFHAGAGAMYHVLETLWLRFDLKYSVNPGDSLYLDSE